MGKSKNQLSAIEQRDRTRLEQTLRQSIQEAQSELALVEKLGLWRRTHETFSEYCTQRFGFNPIDLDVETLLRFYGKN